MSSQKFTIAFYNQILQRLLLLPCTDVPAAIDIVLLRYNLNDPWFINVYEANRFVERHYVRYGKRTPLIGTEFQIWNDPLLRAKQIAIQPTLNWSLLLKEERTNYSSTSKDSLVSFFHLKKA